MLADRLVAKTSPRIANRASDGWEKCNQIAALLFWEFAENNFSLHWIVAVLR